MASAHGTGDHIISVQPEANGLSHVQPDYGWAVPLIKAMERGDWTCFKTQLDLDSSVKSRRINSRGDTFLHLAIRDTGKVQFVEFELELLHCQGLKIIGFPDSDEEEEEGELVREVNFSQMIFLALKGATHSNIAGYIAEGGLLNPIDFTNSKENT